MVNIKMCSNYQFIGTHHIGKENLKPGTPMSNFITEDMRSEFLLHSENLTTSSGFEPTPLNLYNIN